MVQQRILDMVLTWMGSDDRKVRSHMIVFFQDLPDQENALKYLLEVARKKVEQIENSCKTIELIYPGWNTIVNRRKI